MTDKQKWIELLTELNIEFKDEKTYSGGNTELVLEQGMRNVGGYNGFLTVITFNSGGKFLEIGAYE